MQPGTESWAWEAVEGKLRDPETGTDFGVLLGGIGELRGGGDRAEATGGPEEGGEERRGLQGEG